MDIDAFETEGLEILDEAECRSLLELHHVGRVIVVVEGAAAVFPVNYGIVGGDIVFFTGEGTKLRVANRSALVTFEVDAIDLASHTGWSVMVVGTAELASPSVATWARSIGVFPWAVGDRHHAVRIRPEMISGRR